MKIKDGFELRNICGENIVISHGKENINFTKIITLNESAALIWNNVADKIFDVEDMATALVRFDNGMVLSVEASFSLNIKKDVGTIPVSITADIVQAARTAVGMDSPLSAEQFLYEYRLSVLNTMQPLNGFSVDAVFAYGVRLMLVQRMKVFDKEKGTDSYHKIYDTILGEK